MPHSKLHIVIDLATKLKFVFSNFTDYLCKPHSKFYCKKTDASPLVDKATAKQRKRILSFELTLS